MWQNKFLQDSGEERDMNKIHSNDLGRKIDFERIFETLFTGHKNTR